MRRLWLLVVLLSNVFNTCYARYDEQPFKPDQLLPPISYLLLTNNSPPSNIHFTSSFRVTILDNTSHHSLAQQIAAIDRNNLIDLININYMVENNVAEQILSSCDVKDLFAKYHCYAHPYYLNHIRRRPEYKDAIIALYQKVHSDHRFRGRTRSMVGFPKKGTFHQCVANEVNKIIKEGKLDAVHNEVLLQCHHLYANESFIKHIRGFPEYDNAIKTLHSQIVHNKDVNEQTQKIIGFAGKYGFHDFIKNEAQHIEAKEHARAEYLQALKGLGDVFYEQSLESCDQQDNNKMVLYHQRYCAIQKTIENPELRYDYASQITTPIVFNSPDDDVFNNCTGTALDHQLHQELCDIRQECTLLVDYVDGMQLKIIVPAINELTVAAKKETNPVAAFDLADVGHSILNIATALGNGAVRGLCATGHGTAYVSRLGCRAGVAAVKGLWNATKTIASPAHWGDIITGQLHMAKLLVEAIAESEVYQDEWDTAITMGDSATVGRLIDEARIAAQAKRDARDVLIAELCKKIKTTSWDTIIEKGVEHGATFLFDIFALHSLNGVTKKVSREAIKQLSAIIDYGPQVTEQWAVEVAGFGKLLLEDGVETANTVADALKTNNALFKAASKFKAGATSKIKKSIIQEVQSTIAADPAQSMLQKIQSLGDGLIDHMENIGGHTISDHVSKTYNDLLARFSKKQSIMAATSFTNKRIASNAIKENLRNNVKEIVNWLGDITIKDKLIIDHLHKYPIGNGILKGKSNPVYNLLGSRVVLVPHTMGNLGFRIVTAFPIAI